ncbi:efflux RND transporter permease subunit [uncultured Muribaculum sp.]|uniref:efflux RND transporter permease subunit n=1 Tax=uncultured Muribaculum sp. TaxID=1918613 RepID=UPI0025F19E86|nr:efflux RND transporter permease subunit [uncultured Muribaculum sp.]
MLNRIIKGSLSRRKFVLLTAALLLVGGCVAMLRDTFDVDIFPDLNAPTVAIMTEARGLAPEEVEKLVTYPIETAMGGAPGVRRVRSSSSAGFSVVWIEHDWGVDPYKARQGISERLAGIGASLPPEVGVPVMGPPTSVLGEVLIIGLTSRTDSLATDSITTMQLRSIADRKLRPALLAIEGVAQVSVLGGQEEEIQIKVNAPRMRHYGITLDEVIAACDGINTNSSGGSLSDFGNEYLVKGSIATERVEDLAMTVVKIIGDSSDPTSGTPVTLGDIAVIERGGATPRIGAAGERGREAVLLTVSKQSGASTTRLTKAIEDKLAQLAPTLPKGMNISTDIFRQADFIDSSVSNLQQSLFEGAIFVIVVLFFFLMDIRTTLVSVIAIPMSIIVTILVLHLLGLTINTMTLGGIAIAIGSLVDDAIVDVENVYKRLRANRALPEEERRNVISVVYEASREVRMPIFNSSLIIMASFLPLFFLHGIEGRLLGSLGIAFIISLIASTIVALTLTPVLCSYLLDKSAARSADKEPIAAAWLRRTYGKGLASSMRHKRAILWCVGVLFAVSMFMIFTLGRSFLPPFNEGSFTINISAMPGISLEESDRIGRTAEKIIMEVPEINTVARKTGRAELDEHSLGVNVSEIEAPYTLSSRSRSEVAADLRHRLAEIPGVNIEIGQPVSHRIDAMLSGTEAQIAIKIFGPDLSVLHRTATDISYAIGDVKGIADVAVEQQVERPHLELRPRRAAMAYYGVTPGQLARWVDVNIGGAEVGKVYDDGIPRSIKLMSDDRGRESIDGVSNLTIDTPRGAVPVSYVADIVSTGGPNTINRENLNRRIVVSANVDGRDLRGTVDDARRAIEEKVTVPEGYNIVYSGQFESEAAATRTLVLASIGALVIILLLLYMEFHDLTESLIILVNMPLAIIGGVLMLRVTSGELNIPAIIGFISLLGITTRNGMLLISRYNSLKHEGLSLSERIASGSTDRLLPIVMTALTSALALAPLALRGGDPGNELQSPMAIVILGGLLTSTLLNIFIIPILYYYAQRRKK